MGALARTDKEMTGNPKKRIESSQTTIGDRDKDAWANLCPAGNTQVKTLGEEMLAATLKVEEHSDLSSPLKPSDKRSRATP